MGLFGKKTAGKSSYDPDTQRPALMKSICSGETAAGFQDKATGKFTEVTLVKTEADIQAFMKAYGLKERPETIY